MRLDFGTSCFICCCDPGLTRNGWEIGHVIAKLLPEAGTAENPRNLLLQGWRACFAPGCLWCVWMLLCIPQTADLAPSSVGRAWRGVGVWLGGCEQGGAGQSKPQGRENTCSLPGTERGLISTASKHYALSSLRVIFPFTSNQITFLKTQQRPRKETFPLMEKPSVVQGRIW